MKSAEFSYKKVRETPYQVWENDTKTVVITRIGLANAATAFSWAASELDFESAINIGAAGAASPKFGAQELGEIFDVRSVSCIEPYCGEVFEMQTMGGCETATLATSSRPVASAKDREQAAGMGELVDMEGWALACAAKAFSKTLHKKNPHRLLSRVRYTFQHFVNLQDSGKTRKFLDISLAFRLSERH